MKKLVYGLFLICIAITLSAQSAYADVGSSSFKVYPVKYQLKLEKSDLAHTRYDEGYYHNGEWVISRDQKVNLAKGTLQRPPIWYLDEAVIVHNQFIFSGEADKNKPYGIYRWNLITDEVDLLKQRNFRSFATDGKFLVTLNSDNKTIDIMEIASRKTTSIEPDDDIVAVTNITVDDGTLIYVQRGSNNKPILISADLHTGRQRELGFVAYGGGDVRLLNFNDDTVVWSYFTKDKVNIYALNFAADTDGIPLLVARTDKADHIETNGKWVAWDNGEQWSFVDITSNEARSFAPAVPSDEKITWVSGDTFITQRPHPDTFSRYTTKLYAFETPNPWDHRLQILFDGRKLNFTQKAVTINGLVYVPYRAVFETLGYQVKFEAKTKTIKAQRAGNSMELKVGATAATVFGKKVKLPGAPLDQKANGVYVPLQFVVESLGNTVLWDNVNQSADIQPKRTMGKLFHDNGQLLYSGELAGSDMDGRGTLYREDGSLWYEAIFTKNTIQGYGTLVYPDGSRFEGMFKDGVPTGYGTYKVPSGIIWYRGEFKNGRKDGYGIEYDWELGSFRYEGYWKDNQKHGPGVNMFKNPEEYDMGKQIK